jgi:hypothetical protein
VPLRQPTNIGRSAGAGNNKDKCGFTLSCRFSMQTVGRWEKVHILSLTPLPPPFSRSRLHVPSEQDVWDANGAFTTVSIENRVKWTVSLSLPEPKANYFYYCFIIIAWNSNIYINISARTLCININMRYNVTCPEKHSTSYLRLYVMWPEVRYISSVFNGKKAVSVS